MAKICNNIVCGDKYFFRNTNDELICKCGSTAEQIMEDCRDFDAAVWKNDIHIAASDGTKLVYIKNMSGHWGRGVIAEGAAENIFVFVRANSVEVYFVSGDGLYCTEIGGELHRPSLVDRILPEPSPFASGDSVYYVNKSGILCKNGNREICSGKDISHIFATEKWLCFKELDRLVLAKAETPEEQTSLTRRHGRNAQCPLVVSTHQGETLCWLDGEKVFLSKNAGNGWQRLEEQSTDGFDGVKIFKFCIAKGAEYNLGWIKDGKVGVWGENSIETPGTAAAMQPPLTRDDRDIKEEFHRRLQMEHILNEIRAVHGKVIEIDEKIEKLKKIRTPEVITKISKPVNKRSLSKLHKK